MKSSSPDNSFRVVFAGGGTGGHVYPALAMYESLVARFGKEGIAVLFVGVKGGMENRVLPGYGVALQLLPGRGVRGASLLNKCLAFTDVARGVLTGIRTIRVFRPDVVVGTGGFASVSMVVAAILTGTPRVLQEQNSVPGMVNRRLARFADLVLLSYDESKQAIPNGVEVAVTGNPLRGSRPADRKAGGEFFGLDPDRPTVLVMGGSRGAHSLNTAAADAAGVLLKNSNAQMILLTGERDYETMAKTLAEKTENSDRVVVRAYVDEMYHAYSVADVAVARAGASSVFELSAFGVPTIFVPYPYAADDHQSLNVAPLAGDGAVVVADAELNGERLSNEILSLLEDDTRRNKMSRTMMEWIRVDAAEKAAALITGLVKKKRSSGR